MGSLATSPAQASNLAQEGGLGAASAITTLVYGPVKLVYSMCGLVFGGLAYGLSGGDSDVFNAVITPSVRGDYVVTPRALTGEEPLMFLGKDPRYRDDVLAEF